MSIPLSVDQLDHLRTAARRLTELARAQKQHLETLVTSTEADVGEVQWTMLHCPEGMQARVDHYTSAIQTQLQRSRDGVTTARQLCVAAGVEHQAAKQLLADLNAQSDGEAPLPLGTPNHAVLVVDDHQDNRELLSVVLEGAGFVVRTAANGLEAVIAAYEMRPAVIIMDVTMPVLDGVEATRLIKAIDVIRHARVIAYTARASLDESPVRDLFHAVLQKPSPPDKIVALVQRYAN